MKIKTPLMLHIKRKQPKSLPLQHNAVAPVPDMKLSGHSCVCQLRLWRPLSQAGLAHNVPDDFATHTCRPSAWKPEVEGSQVRGQPEAHHEIYSRKHREGERTEGRRKEGREERRETSVSLKLVSNRLQPVSRKLLFEVTLAEPNLGPFLHRRISSAQRNWKEW